MAFGYHFTLEHQENGWWLVRFPSIPEALTEGETEAEARANAADCVIAALEGYVKAGRPIPRDSERRPDDGRVAFPHWSLRSSRSTRQCAVGNGPG